MKDPMERYLDERLSDNTGISYCQQCKDCILWGHGDAFGNAYDKTSCDIYPYPDMKPQEVMMNTGECPWRTVKG